MKAISTLLIFGFLSTQAFVQEEVWGRRTSFIGIAPASVFDPESLCNGTFATLCGDCFNYVHCMGPTASPVVTQCTNERKYCSQELQMCVTDPPEGQECSAGPTTDFQCTGVGYYPHPTNCSIYYECLASGVAYQDECPPGYAWSTVGMKCRQRILTSDCGTINCRSYPSTFQVLSSNSSYYAYCGPLVNNQQDVFVFKCERPNETFNTVAGLCQFACPGEGLFADPYDPTYYYQCYKSGTKIIYQYKQCAGGRQFSEENQACVAPNPSA